MKEKGHLREPGFLLFFQQRWIGKVQCNNLRLAHRSTASRSSIIFFARQKKLVSDLFLRDVIIIRENFDFSDPSPPLILKAASKVDFKERAAASWENSPFVDLKLPFSSWIPSSVL